MVSLSLLSLASVDAEFSAMLLNLVFVKGVVCITGYQSFGDAFVTASNLLFDPFDFDEVKRVPIPRFFNWFLLYERVY